MNNGAVHIRECGPYLLLEVQIDACTLKGHELRKSKPISWLDIAVAFVVMLVAELQLRALYT